MLFSSHELSLVVGFGLDGLPCIQRFHNWLGPPEGGSQGRPHAKPHIVLGGYDLLLSGRFSVSGYAVYRPGALDLAGCF